MSKRAYSLVLAVIGIALVIAAQKPSEQWMERMGCFLAAFSVVAFFADLKERRGSKQL